jgi:hypothetical protein
MADDSPPTDGKRARRRDFASGGTRPSNGQKRTGDETFFGLATFTGENAATLSNNPLGFNFLLLRWGIPAVNNKKDKGKKKKEKKQTLGVETGELG